MSTNNSTSQAKVLWTVTIFVTAAVVASLGMILTAHGPGNMGYGVLAGGGGMLLALVVALIRVYRRPDSATTLERAWTHTGDERDSRVLTQALALVGLCSPVLVAGASIGLALGAPVAPVVAILNIALVVVFAIGFTRANRRN